MRPRTSTSVLLRAATALAAGVPWGWGCALSTGPGSDAGGTGLPDSSHDLALVRVTNQSLDPVRVWIFNVEGRRHALGSVEPNRERRFEIPRGMVAHDALRLYADPVGGSEPYRSVPFLLEGGQVVEWRLQSLPGQAFIGVH